jgi:hypothetical protein
MEHLESVLSGNSSHASKLEALLPVYMTLLHETVHYGDYLDGLRQDGGEPGNAFEFDVWLSRDYNIDGKSFKAPYMIDDKYEPSNARKIINEKKGQDVLPTVPNK